MGCKCGKFKNNHNKSNTEKENKDTIKISYEKKDKSEISLNNIKLDQSSLIYFTEEQLKYYKTKYENENETNNKHQTKFISDFSKFKKGELLGEGSFGIVYQYFNEENGKIYAVKEINIERLSKRVKDVSQKITTEIELLSKLNHKNIVKYYGVFIEENNLNIIFEYCIGRSLSSLLNIFENFNENIIRKYLIQILDGIEYLHSHNIIHRDIKCANILVNRDGICKLSDFGGAKILKGNYNDNKNLFEGTPNWMAPETIKKLENTRFSDIWSLGCTIIEMIQGFPPWNNYKNPLSVLNIIYKSENPPEIPNNISNVLRDFLNKCLVMEPKDRWNIYQLKKHAFVTGESFGSIYKNISEEVTLNVEERSINNSRNCKDEKEKKNLRNVDNNTFEKDGLG